MPIPSTPAPLRWALAALCITVTVSYGVLFYAFPVLASSIAADTGWSLPWLTAAFSVGQLVVALLGAPIGRWIDRSGPRPAMVTGSLLAFPSLAAVALAPNPMVFFVAWIPAGAASAMLFYSPAFAALTRWYGDRRVRALTMLTLVAGFASTIFAPLSAALDSALDWRAAFLILAGIHLVVTLPLHLVFLRPPWPQAPDSDTATPGASVRSIVRGRAFICLTLAFALCAFAVYGLVMHIVPLLTSRGIDAQTASWALGLGGVGQVLGRFAYAPMARRLGVISRTVLILASCTVTTALLALLPAEAAFLLAAALLSGVARGIFTLLQATAVSDRWGATNYGLLNGIMHGPLLAAIALAPWGGTVLAIAVGGYQELFVLLALGVAIATALAAATRPRRSGAA